MGSVVHRLLVVSISFLIPSAFAGYQSAGKKNPCAENLEAYDSSRVGLTSEFQVRENGAIIFNVKAGGARAQVYPLDFTLRNLGLTEQDLPLLGPNVVLVGEGYGRLFPVLHGISLLSVRAYDPIYGIRPIPQGHMGELLQQFLHAHASTNRLISASADQLPEKSNSVDTVIGHMLLNNFTDADDRWMQQGWKTVIESVRVLRRGGKAIFGQGSADDMELLMSIVQAEMARIWGEEPVIAYSLSHRKETIRYDDYGYYAQDRQGMVLENEPITILTITKLRDVIE